MDNNFWVIFLCLLFGAVIGFEFGKATAIRKIEAFMKKLSEDMHETAKKKKEEQEQRQKNAEEFLTRIGAISPKEDERKKRIRALDEEGNGIEKE